MKMKELKKLAAESEAQMLTDKPITDIEALFREEVLARLEVAYFVDDGRWRINFRNLPTRSVTPLSNRMDCEQAKVQIAGMITRFLAEKLNAGTR